MTTATATTQEVKVIGNIKAAQQSLRSSDGITCGESAKEVHRRSDAMGIWLSLNGNKYSSFGNIVSLLLLFATCLRLCRHSQRAHVSFRIRRALAKIDDVTRWHFYDIISAASTLTSATAIVQFAWQLQSSSHRTIRITRAERATRPTDRFCWYGLIAI